MKITFIVKEFPKTSETFILSQIHGLINLGHDITVVSLRKPHSQVHGQNGTSPCRVVYLGYEGNGFERFVRLGRIVLSYGFRPAFIRYTARCTSFLEILSYPVVRSKVITDADVVLIHYGDLAHRFAFLNERHIVRKPVVAVFHAVDVARYLASLPAHELSRLWNSMILGLPVSGFWKERLERMGCPAHKLRVHHMGVDTGKFRFRKKAPDTAMLRLITVCRLVEKKGIDNALESLPKVCARHPSHTLIFDIIGDGPERKELEHRAEVLGIRDRVNFHGEKTPGEIAELLENADVFLLPSRTSANGDMEGIPVSLMEAMSCGLVVVSTCHSGIPELVADGVSGLLAGENDPDGIAAALSRLIEEPALLEKLGVKAREAVESNFNSSQLNRKLESLLRYAVEKHKSGGIDEQ
jgi:colanic acid/amylovoran biosynthesis glycosyltransferase